MKHSGLNELASPGMLAEYDKNLTVLDDLSKWHLIGRSLAHVRLVQLEQTVVDVYSTASLEVPAPRVVPHYPLTHPEEFRDPYQ